MIPVPQSLSIFPLAVLAEANPSAIPASGSSGVSLAVLLVIGFACWCWLGAGPRCCRWPLVVILVLMTSDHWAESIVGTYVNALASPVLTLLIMFAGLMFMLRGLGLRGRGRNNPDYRYNGRRGWYGDRW